jgi:hypothetical protein
MKQEIDRGIFLSALLLVLLVCVPIIIWPEVAGVKIPAA